MKVEQVRQGSVEVITIVDTVTDDEAEELRAVVESAVCANAGRVVLNVARMPYVDSHGLEALLDQLAHRLHDEPLDHGRFGCTFRVNPELQGGLVGPENARCFPEAVRYHEKRGELALAYPAGGLVSFPA